MYVAQSSSDELSPGLSSFICLVKVKVTTGHFLQIILGEVECLEYRWNPNGYKPVKISN